MESPELFTFWADEKTHESYTAWRSSENDRIADLVISNHNLGKVLEIGFGEGPLTERLIPHSGEYWGIEPVESVLNRTRERLNLDSERLYTSRAEDIMSGPLGQKHGYFDTILLISVLEHLSFPLLILNTCFQLLKPGGRLIVSTPDSTLFKIYTPLRRIFGMEPWTKFHISFFRPSHLREIARRTGFDIEKEDFHPLIDDHSATYFKRLTGSSMVYLMMRLAKSTYLDQMLRINTAYLELRKR
jgi:2-polyprenyl-3-methyl-5-hydroxy-6-metoxy-1,4-benzoquinol methylase